MCSGVRMSLVLQRGAVELVGLLQGRYISFLPTSFHHVAVRRAVEHVELVRGAHAVRGRCAGVVVGDVRGAARTRPPWPASESQARRGSCTWSIVVSSRDQDGAGEAGGCGRRC